MKEDDKSRLSEEGENGNGSQTRGGKGSKGMEGHLLLLARTKNLLWSIAVWEGTSRDVPIFGLKRHSVSIVGQN